MLRATLKSLLARKLRLVLSALAIVLGVGFVAGTLVLTDTLNRTFNSLFGDIDKNTAVEIRAQSAINNNGSSDQSGGTVGGSGKPVPASLVTQVRQVPGVADVRGNVQGTAVLIDPKTHAVLSNKNAPPIGVAWGGEGQLSPLKLASGAVPNKPDQIVVDRGTFDKKHLRIGQQVTVLTQSPPRQSTIVGTFTFGSTNNLAGATLVAFDTPTAQQLLLQPGQFSDIKVAAASGVSQEELRQRIDRILPKGIEAKTGKELIKENADNLAKGLGGFSTFLQAFGYIALFVGAFIISNTFSMLIGQRVRELALLRALGATKRQVQRSVIIEAVVVGFVGSTLGLALGVGVALLLKSLLGAFGVDLPAGGVAFLPRTVIVAYLIGIITTVLSAWGPARRASRVPPVAAMRDVSLERTGGLRRRSLIGGALTALGALLILFGLNSKSSGSGPLVQVGAGAAAVFLGVATLSPLISRPVLRVLGAPFARAFGPIGRLSGENARRSPRRTSATASALMIGLALVSAFTVFGTSLKSSISDLFGSSLKANYIITGGQFGEATFSPDVAAKARALPETQAVSQLRFAQVEVNGKKTGIQAMNAEGVTDVLNLQREQGDLTLGPDNVLMSQKELNDKKLQVGQNITITWAETGPKQLRIAGTYADNQLAGNILVSLDTYQANVTNKLDNIVLVTAKDGADLASLRKGLNGILTNYPNLDVRDKKEYVAQVSKNINQILGLVQALLVFAIVIATIGIINTLLLSVVERTRELGMLRAVGMQRRQVRRMVRYEAVMIAVYGGLLGLVVGSIFGWALTAAFKKNNDFGTFSYPAVTLIIYLVIAGILGVLAAVGPARRAAKTNMLEAIAAT